VSTVLESADHALQIKYGYLFTKLTFRSFSERLKKVSCAKFDLGLPLRIFFCESTVLFSRTTHNTTSHQLVDQLSKPCPMASESSDDGHESHLTTLMMPRLASEAIKAVNFVVGLMKQPPRQHKNEVMADSSCSSAQDVLGREGQ
jgi:hypothetical protein